MTFEQLLEVCPGFDAVGVAPAVRAPHAEDFYRWLGEGMHADMHWLAKEPGRRCNPTETLPGARSVIALGLNYFTEPQARADGRGRIARYALGRDYHHVIRKMLKSLDRSLAAMGGQQRCFVDSGPLLERDFAVLAGIAWHGKSTLALHPKLGTYFFLSAVATTLDIEPSPPMTARCGSCTRCIDACPTGAIVAPHKVDAGRCISYWTIEHKGSLPEWIRPLLGDRIFGCDDCLDACPWNRFALASRVGDFQPRPASLLPLRDYLAWDEDTFLKMFEGSPIRRAGRQGFLRNVCTALGNVGNEDDLPALQACAHDSDPVVSEHARWAVQQIRSCAQER